MNERLKQLRKALGMNQQEMAESLGIAQPTYSQLEKKVHAVSAKYVELLRLKHGINPEWLTTGEGDMFIKSSKDEEFFAAYEGLSDESKKLVFDMIMKLKKADE